jgi:hypothetical protein
VVQHRCCQGSGYGIDHPGRFGQYLLGFSERVG